MMLRRLTLGTAILAFSGGAVVLLGQQEATRQPGAQPDTKLEPRPDGKSQAAQRPPRFVRGEKLLGREVKDLDGAPVGKVKDLVIERGSGRVSFAAIDRGSDRPMAAVPLESLRWGRADGRELSLKLSSEQLAAAPEFKAEEWKDGGAPAWATPGARGGEKPGADPYADALRDARPDQLAQIEGTVREVAREDVAGSEQVVVSIDTLDAGPQRVALGPAWYIMSRQASPMRGEAMRVSAHRPAGGGKGPCVAYAATIDGKELILRDMKGVPTWAKGAEAGKAGGDRYLLLSALNGAGVVCRGESCGEVEDVVIERRTGRVVALAIDPNEAFLGIGDTLRLIPYSVVRVSAETGAVRLDASREMVLQSEPAPSDTSALTPEAVQRAYRAFHESAPRLAEADDRD